MVAASERSLGGAPAVPGTTTLTAGSSSEGALDTEQMVCFIHTDRPTRVTCSSCGRPICPADMTPAPVGYQCPVCTGRMREGAGAVSRSGYRVRSNVSARADRSPLGRMLRGASVTKIIMGIDVAVLALMYLTGGLHISGETLLRFGAVYEPLPSGEWWRLFTAMFVHVGVWHLLLNMWGLLLFGPALEQRYGKARFLTLYLGAGLLGSGFSVAFHNRSLGAGASGAILGILGAWVAFYWTHRHISSMRGQLGSMLFLVGFEMFYSVAQPGIDVYAHLGGLIGGFVIGAALEWSARKGRTAHRIAWTGSTAAVVIAALALAVTHMI